MEWDTLKALFKNSVKTFLGICCLVVGVLGLFLPFLQGIAMIMLGLALLGNKDMIQKLKNLASWIENKFKK